MLKKVVYVLILFSLVLLSGCRTVPSRAGPPSAGTDEPGPGAGFWDATPFDNELVFHGAAGVLSSREESIRLALEDAARKVSVFNSVEGQFYSYTNIGARTLDYSSDAAASLWYDQDYQQYVEALSFDPERDILQHENAIFVRVRYYAPAPVRINYRPPVSGRDIRPEWIDRPPDIAGYTVGVGFAGRRLSPRDTVNSAYESAIFSIIKNISATVSATATDFQGSGAFDFSSASGSTLAARGVLRGFYVLDTWTDPLTLGVWTLAVARDAVQY
jgi:hypothetical protein